MFDEKEIAYLQEMEERITRSMAVLIESDVTPKFSLLADGICLLYTSDAADE